MTRTLHLQCNTGISGDMVVGALLDLGADQDGLCAALDSLGLDGYEVRITRKMAGALDACDFDVVVDDEHLNHDHDMDWLFGAEDGHEHGREHYHPGHDHHDHEHHHHGHGHHEHRNLADISAIIGRSNLSDHARELALRIFGIVAAAEAKAHGQTVDTVHFHEVGAVDSIVDVVATAWCVDNLGIDDAVVSPLYEGEGTIRCAHGILSIPVPAVANIVEAHGLVLKQAHRKGELVTPTGAAIAAALDTRASLPEQYRILATGIGTGKRAYDPPSSVRAMLVEDAQSPESIDEPSLWKLETEVDDCSGETLGHVLDLLFEAGAREAHFVPVFMKKGRPGYQIEVICDRERIPALERLLFEETTTIGVRRYALERTALEREEDELQSAYGPVRAKRVILPNGKSRTYAEYDSVAFLAQESGASYMDVVRSLRYED